MALITGGDSGIGRAVALAFAREGADVAISYLNEHSDAEVRCERPLYGLDRPPCFHHGCTSTDSEHRALHCMQLKPYDVCFDVGRRPRRLWRSPAVTAFCCQARCVASAALQQIPTIDTPSV